MGKHIIGASSVIAATLAFLGVVLVSGQEPSCFPLHSGEKALARVYYCI